jgi:hypothetical protein
MTLTGVYGFWKYVSNLERRETRRYLEMFYALKYRSLVGYLTVREKHISMYISVMIYAFFSLLNPGCCCSIGSRRREHRQLVWRGMKRHLQRVKCRLRYLSTVVFIWSVCGVCNLMSRRICEVLGSACWFLPAAFVASNKSLPKVFIFSEFNAMFRCLFHSILEVE